MPGIRRHAWNTGQSALRTGRASSPSRARRAWGFLCCASSSSTRGSSRVHRRRCPSPWWTISLSKSACPRPPGRSMTGTVGPSSGTARRFGNTWASAKPPSPMARHWSPGSVRSSCPPRAAQIISRRRWRSGAVPSVSHRRPGAPGPPHTVGGPSRGHARGDRDTAPAVGDDARATAGLLRSDCASCLCP